MCTGEPAEKAPPPFMATYAKTHPIGIYLFPQWAIFKSLLEDAVAENSMAPFDLKDGVEEWDLKTFVNDPSTACQSDEVGIIGKSFLIFIKEELKTKGWGGKLDYAISSLGDTGFMHVTAIVDVGDGHPTSVMDIKPYYYIM